MILVIPGNANSQKNQKTIAVNRKTGRPFVMSNKLSVAWKKAAVATLTHQFQGYRITDYPVAITIVFYLDSRRRRDLDNMATGVMDAMVQSGVIEDDSVGYVSSLTLQYGGLDKANPRTEIHLQD